MDNLDRQIAEQVMGWKLIQRQEGCHSFTWVNKNNQTEAYLTEFKPSSNLDDAMRVVKKLETHGFWVGRASLWSSAMAGWIATFYQGVEPPPNINTTRFTRSGNTPAEAICQAALATIDESTGK